MDDSPLTNQPVPKNSRCRCFSKTLATLMLALAMLLPAQQVVGQASVDNDPQTPQQVVRQGDLLESQGQWGEALNLYQHAVRKFPADSNIKTRRSVARIHYDLQRRYADRSFIATIKETDANKASGVYSEVLLKVQSYYVDSPNWADLASYGLTSLEVALMSDDFQRINLPGITSDKIRETILATRKRLESARVNNRQDAHSVATQTAQFLQSKIGLAPQATMYEFTCGAISALDPYSAFMSSNQYGETMSQIEGNFVGLGVELRTHSDHLEIVSVIRGGSAFQGGIQDGDRIIAVDHQTVQQYGSDRVADLMRGPEGSEVSVTIDRGNGPQVVKLQRRRVEIPSIENVSIVDPNAGVGYIKLTNFQKTTVRDFDAALWKLSRQGMRSLIVDVRGNPGGLLNASVEIADRFISQGVIVQTRGRNPMENYIHRANEENTWRVPLVVLVDENSASASEIFAAAIRDHARGLIVGERSYGKGSVQGIFPLNISGGGVRLTTAKFYSPTDQAINEVGVAADIELHQVAKSQGQQVAVGDDNGLRIGIQAARRVADQRSAAIQQKKSAAAVPPVVRYQGL